MDADVRKTRKARFGRGRVPPEAFDVTLSAEYMDAMQMAEILRAVESGFIFGKKLAPAAPTST
jgi:hypothetical protein